MNKNYDKKKVGCELLLDLILPQRDSLTSGKVKSFLNSFYSSFKNEITVVREITHIFPNKNIPDGVTYLAVLQESHVAIHTYPEINLISINIYFCSTKKELFERMKEFIIDYFNPTEKKVSHYIRGV